MRNLGDAIYFAVLVRFRNGEIEEINVVAKEHGKIKKEIRKRYKNISGIKVSTI